MTRELEGRVALVTGSATGLRRSITVKLAERGADVIVNHSESSAEAEAFDLCRTAGAKVKVVQANVADPGGCRTAFGLRHDLETALVTRLNWPVFTDLHHHASECDSDNCIRYFR